MLLHCLPIDILFNPDSNVSNLHTIKLNHPYAEDIYGLQTCLQQQTERKQVKSMKFVNHCHTTTGDGIPAPRVYRYINAKHVWLDER